MAEEKSTAPKSNPLAKLKGLVLPLFLVVNLGVSGYGLYLVFLSTLGWQRPAITEEEEMKRLGEVLEAGPARPLIYTMDKFTVNLDGLPKRMIRTEVSLEMLDEEGFEEVVTLGAQARDAIVRILNAKSFDDIETLQGKLFLKNQIASTINSFLKNGVIKEVYFSEFIVQ